MEAAEDVHTRHTVVTEFMTVEGYSPKETHRCLRSMCGEDAKDISSVRCWVHHFNSGGKNNGNRPHSDPSATAAIMETTDRVDAMILNNCCITARELGGRNKGLENQQLWTSSEKLATEKSTQNWC